MTLFATERLGQAVIYLHRRERSALPPQEITFRLQQFVSLKHLVIYGKDAAADSRAYPP